MLHQNCNVQCCVDFELQIEMKMSLSECVRKFECVCAEFIVSEIIIGAPKIWCNPIINIPILQYLRCKWAGYNHHLLSSFPPTSNLASNQTKIPYAKTLKYKIWFLSNSLVSPPPPFHFWVLSDKATTIAFAIVGWAITIWRAIQKRNHHSMYKPDTKMKQRG